MKVLILGGSSGFIGSHLSSRLKGSYDLQFFSMRKFDWINQVISTNCIINLVGKAHDFSGTATEQDFYYANVDLVKIAFQQFLTSDASLFVHVSSLAAVEEFESDKALSEGDECHPVSWYGKSKRAAEEWLMSQQLPADKKMIILRPPMVHGPGDKGNLGMLYKFISRGIPYPLAGFDNNRSFISIDNFCYFIEQIIINQGKLRTGIYHISDDESIATKDIIEIIKKVTGKNTINLSLPKFVVIGLAKVGDFIPIPLNTKRLKKMTSNLLVSNQAIKNDLGIDKLPLTAREGMEKTIRTFRDTF
ncbi:NAD-dependent epimerase/dehydratase family protein [Sphingobacterium faecium]|uniref:NAD-dependent epimerase/dehydratase family protein n=1 Tax=Sphingobacterium faecium TaxID=34087 RepID=UPI002468AF01|nr:NAD-dependent epimerase/dehydratase family protein [Sphingobacterium faecium]MDH5828687.1 NAD-dependent epimerase/dehydratase family protein [Sphingobacterium faecium]